MTTTTTYVCDLTGATSPNPVGWSTLRITPPPTFTNGVASSSQVTLNICPAGMTALLAAFPSLAPLIPAAVAGGQGATGATGP